MTQNTWGAIFDFDGVIVDTALYHEQAWQQTAKELGKTVSYEQFTRGLGVKNARFVSGILGWTSDPEEIAQISKRKEEIFQEYARSHRVMLIAGLIPWLQVLVAHHIPCAIGSSSIRDNIDISLQSNGISSSFSAIISGEFVQHGKPDPEVFLLAAKALQIAPEACVVFEDALLGIEAAQRAYCKTIALTTTFKKSDFLTLSPLPHKIVPDFTMLDFMEINSWFCT
jgi:beta-phosphoglucomutase